MTKYEYIERNKINLYKAFKFYNAIFWNWFWT